MKRVIGMAVGAVFAIAFLSAAQDVLTATHGTVEKVDSASKTMVIKTSDGAEHTLHFLDRTAVHGAHASAAGGKDSWHGLQSGTEVVAHYTTRGTEDTAVEVDKVGEEGLKKSTGTITDIDRGAKALVVKGDDGVDSTYRLTDHAAKDGGKDLAAGAEKGAKVTVYYTETAGKKIAHFFGGA
ncbi:MAG TPA: hypothetical protein VEJ67_04695 [Candidatus Cybelea sp.]|nr:hypothetical protein [Candidatus Cybelea sp.]